MLLATGVSVGSRGGRGEGGTGVSLGTADGEIVSVAVGMLVGDGTGVSVCVGMNVAVAVGRAVKVCVGAAVNVRATTVASGFSAIKALTSCAVNAARSIVCPDAFVVTRSKLPN